MKSVFWGKRIAGYRIDGECPKCKTPIKDTGCFVKSELEELKKKKKLNYFCGLRHGAEVFDCIKCGTLLIEKHNPRNYVEPPKCSCGTPFWVEDRQCSNKHLEEMSKNKKLTYVITKEPFYVEWDKLKKMPIVTCVSCGKKIKTENGKRLFSGVYYSKPGGNCPACQLSVFFTEYGQQVDKYLQSKAKKKEINYVTYNRNEFVQLPKQVKCIGCKTIFRFKPNKSRW